MKRSLEAYFTIASEKNEFLQCFKMQRKFRAFVETPKYQSKRFILKLMELGNRGRF